MPAPERAKMVTKAFPPSGGTQAGKPSLSERYTNLRAELREVVPHKLGAARRLVAAGAGLHRATQGQQFHKEVIEHVPAIIRGAGDRERLVRIVERLPHRATEHQGARDADGAQ